MLKTLYIRRMSRCDDGDETQERENTSLSWTGTVCSSKPSDALSPSIIELSNKLFFIVLLGLWKLINVI